MSDTKQRLDAALVQRGHFATRSRARDAILRGTISINGIPCKKPSTPVTQCDQLTVDDPASRYVSRAALKLVAGLEAFGFDPSGRTALDIGASTGGFTQVLLEHGADHVMALDVGEGQMADSLRHDHRVTVLEKTNARSLDVSFSGPLGHRSINALVSDVSFISLKLALPPSLEKAEPESWAIFLIKPQFEVGKDGIGKGGLVTPPALADRAAEGISAWLAAQDCWRVAGMVPSPIKGGDGNREFLLGAVKDAV